MSRTFRRMCRTSDVDDIAPSAKGIAQQTEVDNKKLRHLIDDEMVWRGRKLRLVQLITFCQASLHVEKIST